MSRGGNVEQHTFALFPRLHARSYLVQSCKDVKTGPSPIKPTQIPALRARSKVIHRRSNVQGTDQPTGQELDGFLDHLTTS